MRIISLIFTIAIFLTITSCYKKEFVPTEDNTIEYNSNLTKEVIDVQSKFDITNELLDEVSKNIFGNNMELRDFSCAEISHSSSFGHFPNTITIDFGNGCEINDSLTFSGEIIMTFSGFLNHTGDSLVVTYNDFYANNNNLIGTCIRKNMGKDDNGNRVLLEKVIGGKIIKENGDYSTFEKIEYVTIYNNGSFFNFEETKIGVTGDFTGQSFDGITYQGEIITELITPFDCGCTVSGSFDLIVDSEDRYNMNYGDGTCDKVAILTYPDNTTEEVEICK